MTVKKYILIFAIILAAILIFTLIFTRVLNKEVLLKRLPVSVVAVNTASEDIKPDIEFEAFFKEKIPGGTLKRIAGKRRFSIKPSIKGKKGIFFTLAAKSIDKKKIKTAILLKRRGYESKIQEFRGRKYFHSFSKEMAFLKDDEILIDVQGNGGVIVNQPIIYDVVDKKRRRYVFIIALDTLRADRVGFKRNGIELTPAINRFKKDAAIFSNAYAQSSWTLPSFISFFTGLYEFNHQITRTTALEEKKPFLIEQIGRNFFTVNYNAGLWMEGKFGFSRGFDFFSVMSSPTDSFGGKKLFSNAIDFLKRNNIPFVFMFLHTYQIHAPYAPPEEYLKKIVPNSSYKNLDSFYYDKQFIQGIDNTVREAMEELYDAEILAFDHFFARFIRELKELGIYDQSLIVFFSDHGEEFYEHKGWAHCHSMYNEVIKVPLFFKFPGNNFKSKEIKANIGLIDILPTILDFNNIKIDTPIDGMSLMPLLRGEKWERENLFSSTSVTWLVKNIPPKFAIIKGNFKLIYNYPYSRGNLDFFSEFGLPPGEELIRVFDLNKDPQEFNPIGKREEKMIKKKFMPHIKKLKETIGTAMKKKRKPTIRMTEEEKRKLESLGYLSQ